MNVVERFGIWFTRSLRHNFDLLLLWWVLVCAQVMVPLGHPLARPDLVPWMILALALAAMLRARPLGEGPHPMLAPRHARLARRARKLTSALLPVLFMLLYMGARALPPWATASTRGNLDAVVYPLAAVPPGLILFAVLARLGRDHRLTPWNPEKGPGYLLWSVPLCLAMVMSLAAGLLGGAADVMELQRPVGPGLNLGALGGIMLYWVGPSVLLGISFAAASQVMDHPRNHRQRKEAGLRSGEKWRPRLFRPILGLLGPSLGLWMMAVVFEWAVPRELVDFDQAHILSLHVVAWAGVLWARPQPLAVYCLLHEVVPVGGGDQAEANTALDFDRPPEGALRLNPLRVRRTRAVHAWVVPVRGARIDALDDPVRPLWGRRPPLRQVHIMGEAACEPIKGTHNARWDAVTIHIRGTHDVSQVSGADAQSRHIAVLRAFPVPPQSRRAALATYRWDRAVPAVSHQVVDATTTELELRDGAILVLSTEGVARAFELEIGAALHDWTDLFVERPPQLEDYAVMG